MADERMDREAIIQNLKDAGCSEDFVDCFLRITEQGCAADQLDLLARQRRQLLQQVHDGQRKLDCLDYLRYKLKGQQAGRR